MFEIIEPMLPDWVWKKCNGGLNGAGSVCSTQSASDVIPFSITDDCGEDQHARQKIRHNKQILHIVLRRWRLADRGQRERRPIKRVNVLSRKRRIDRPIYVVDPVVGAESERVAYGKV